MKLSAEQEKELETKLEQFEKFVEAEIELHIENEKNQVENGEYDYLVESGNVADEDSISLSEDLEEALDKSSISKSSLIEQAISTGNYSLEYNTQSSPFEYGSPDEDEFHCIQWGGDKDLQLDLTNVESFRPSFDLKSFFKNVDEFKSYVSYNIGSHDYLKSFFAFFVIGESSQWIKYNTDYDIVRVKIKDTEPLLSYLMENPKPAEIFNNKTLYVTVSEFKDLRGSHDGFCFKCGKINEGSHEPDAEKYECNHCNTMNSYGVEQAFVVGQLVIVDKEEDSNLDDAY